ncbi:Homogentisate 1,2-dioxygenase [Irpex rosettiformis]|uniref:Homogentisate 1,2-dioxygenase n=1 Tax=Irpex rosettiformis TaxID=378272 RepID=A0ACB8U7M8_9APHY|nr:Homogentisate 1,2-dioxygenase [Irpex rosettiformis]
MAAAQLGYTVRRKEDSYQYQVGFGNSFASEAIPGVLPIGQNNPQKVKYDLYAEGLNGTPFTTPRGSNERTWFYRIRPSVAHLGFYPSEQPNTNIEAEFSLKDPKQHISPTQLTWSPLPIPSDNSKVTFIDGIATILGNGGPTAREGLAIHLYSANASMEKTAFVNSDGDFLIVPAYGRLDVQTELGRLLVGPGEIAVIQRGIKWKVSLPDGSARGYIQEIFGSHYELPELGPLGANGLANVRDFEHPVAHFDLDQTPWDVVYKLGGKYFTCKQNHTPFDVVAWHGNYVPYKYDLDAFISIGSVTKDHLDPSVFTVLTAKSKTSGVALADFAVFKERWDVATGTFRPPYFHRNTCVEVIGVIKGTYAGRSEDAQIGGLSFENGFCPHGVDINVFTEATESELVPTKIGKDSIMVLFESSMMCTITDFGIKNKKGEHEASMWDGLTPNFLKHVGQINEELKAAKLPALVQN